MKSSQVFLGAVAVLTCFYMGVAQAKYKKLEDFEILQKNVEKNLAKFDKLDFTDFSGQKWENFKDMLRHASLSEAQETSGDLKITQTLAGHSNIATTERYAKARDCKIREVQIRMGQNILVVDGS